MRNRLSLLSLVPHWPFLTLTKVSTHDGVHPRTKSKLHFMFNSCKYLVKLHHKGHLVQPGVPGFEFLPADFSKNFVFSEVSVFRIFSPKRRLPTLTYLKCKRTLLWKIEFRTSFCTSGCNISALLFQVVYLFSILKSLYENTGIKVAKFIEPLIPSSGMSRCEWFESFVKLEHFINNYQSILFLPICTFAPRPSNRYMSRNRLSIILPRNVE